MAGGNFTCYLITLPVQPFHFLKGLFGVGGCEPRAILTIMMPNLRRLQHGILPLEGVCVSFCLAALLQRQRTLSGLKHIVGRVGVTKVTSEQLLYLSSFFSATLSGIALSMRTRSLTDRFCRLFTRRSLFVAVTHERGQRLFTGSLILLLLLLPPPSPLLTLCVVAVRLNAVAPDARPARVREDLDGRSALPAPPQLHGPVVILGDDGSPAAA